MVCFFDALRDIVVSQPYVSLGTEELKSLLSKLDCLANKGDAECAGFGYVCALCQAVQNAKSDGYFPIVVLPKKKYEAAISFLEGAE